MFYVMKGIISRVLSTKRLGQRSTSAFRLRPTSQFFGIILTCLCTFTLKNDLVYSQLVCSYQREYMAWQFRRSLFYVLHLFLKHGPLRKLTKFDFSFTADKLGPKSRKYVRAVEFDSCRLVVSGPINCLTFVYKETNIWIQKKLRNS